MLSHLQLTAWLHTFKEHDLDPNKIVSQGYDGASVMSSRCTGVQKRIREFAPYGRYVHFYAHNLNLALVDSVKNIPDASEFFAFLQSLYVFMSITKAHDIFMQKQIELNPGKQPRQLPKLSETRWAYQYRAVNSICFTLDAIVETLQVIADGLHHDKAIEARGLLYQVQNFEFLLSLIVFDRVLSCTFSLSQQLQEKSINLAKASDLVLATR